MKETMTMGKRLASERKRLGLNQDHIAKTLNIGRSALAMIEAGKSGLDASRLATLDVVGIDTIYVMSGLHRAEMVDWQIVSQILHALDTWSKSRRIELGPAKTARALKILYAHFQVTGILDEPYLADLMGLAA